MNRAALLLGACSVFFAGCNVEPFCVSGCEGDVDAGPADGAALDGAFDGGVREGGPDTRICVPTEEPTEVCNGLDDDCNGNVDESFDFQVNPRHCGECGNECRFVNADGSCVAGSCEIGDCFDGFVDLDDAAGCEYACPVFPPAGEECNGFDDDCDGNIDEAIDLPPPPADLCRTTPGTLCEAVVPACTTREGRTTWFCQYPAGVEFDPLLPSGILLEETLCDGFDGDCDGLADEPFETLGDTCDNGARGACRDVGVIACDPADATAVVCDLSVLPDATPGAPFAAELCNGIDDDCDGTIDDADPGDPSRVIDDMVHVVRGGLDYYIYRHEASRPDAQPGDAGESGARACGRTGVQPWAQVGYAEAEAACTAAGHRLCTAAEWQNACRGAGTTYPYGNTYQPSTCNAGDNDAIPGGAIDSQVLNTGALMMCVVTDKTLNMSGNLKEWTDDFRGTTAGGSDIYVVRGGGYESPSFGATCDTDLSRATVDTLLPSIGFRCCRDSAP